MEDTKLEKGAGDTVQAEEEETFKKAGSDKDLNVGQTSEKGPVFQGHGYIEGGVPEFF